MGKDNKTSKNTSKITAKEREPKLIPFDELLLKAIDAKSRKKKGGS